jgi:hypothetical protein
MGRSGATQTWPQKERGRRKLILIKILKARLIGLFLYLHAMKKAMLLALMSIFMVVSCKKDKQSDKLTPSCDGSAPTYESTIKSIIDSKCATSNCHSNYSTYGGLQTDLQDGDFRREVLVDQTMPQGSSLTQDQLNKIQCWANNGFPEN